MASEILGNLKAEVANDVTVMGSATALINGFAARQQAAIAAAIANGATAEELAPVQSEVDALKASAADLAKAVTANTPAAPSA